MTPAPLRRPVALVAFEGWNDAGDAASGAVDHLLGAWEHEPAGEVDPEDFYDFQVTRPMVSYASGDQRTITWPTTRLSVARLPELGRDVVLVRGIEPNMRWRGFCADVLDRLEALGVELVVTLGALLADTPHTRPVPVTGTASDPGAASELGLQRSRYEGPTGIVGVLQERCTARGITGVSLWAAVPHYVSQPPCPKATLALLRRVEDLLDVAVPVGELPDAAEEWERTVSELAAEDEEVAEYVATLEQREAEDGLEEASGEDIARQFERYLRRRGRLS